MFLNKQLICRFIISSITCSLIYPYIQNKLTLISFCGAMTIWTDIYKIIPSSLFKKYFKNKYIKNSDSSSSEGEDKSERNHEDDGVKYRRRSWKRELKINTELGGGSFIDNSPDTIPVKIEDDNSITDNHSYCASDDNSSQVQESKTNVKRKRIGKKMRARLERKKRRMELLEHNKTESSSNCNNADVDTNSSEYNKNYESNYSDNSYDNKEIINNYNNDFDSDYDKYAGMEYEFEPTPLENKNEDESVSYSIDNVDLSKYLDIPKTSRSYYEFLKEAAKNIGYKYNIKYEEGYLTDGNNNNVDEVLDEMINYRDIDFENRRIIDTDGYWKEVCLRKLDKHIEKYGKGGEIKSYNQSLEELLSELKELKEITSILRLCGVKLKGWRARGILRVNMWWMREELRIGEKMELNRLAMNRLWVYVGKNIEKLLESWGDQDEDNEYGLWSEGTTGNQGFP